MAGKLEIKHNFSGLGDYLIVRWFKTSAPTSPASGTVNGVTVTQVVYPAPHNEEALVITDVDPAMYVVRFYASAGGVTPDSEIPVSLAVDASMSAVNILEYLTYIVDRGDTGDPADGDTELVDPRLLDKKFMVYERGTGPLIPDDEPNNEWVYRNDLGGGFSWVDPGKVFVSGAIYTVVIQSEQDVVTTGGGSGSYADIVDITANSTDYDVPTHSGKILNAAGSGNTQQFDIADLLSVADSRFKMINQGSVRNMRIQFDTGDTVNFRGQAVNLITLGQGEYVEIIFKNNIAYVGDHNTGYDRLGEERWTRSTSALPNTLVSGSGPFTETDYLRVGEYLDSITTVSLAAWTTNRGMWGRSGGQFRPPEFVDFIRAVASNPGRTEAGSVGPHTHNAPVAPNGGTPGANIYGRGGDSGSEANIENSGTGIGTETRPKNIGLILHFCI